MSQSKPGKSPDFTDNNKVKTVRGGSAYFNLLVQLINGATESIHLQTYIFDDDETGTIVANALQDAAARKVEVYLLADGYASQSMPDSFIESLKSAGVHFRYFEPFFKSKNYYFGRRLHHKVFVADARYALVGGINIANRYNDMPDEPAWLDYALYAEGTIAQELCVLCWKTWNGFPVKMDITPCEKKQLLFDITPEEKTRVLMRRNDWVRQKNEISSTYIHMLRYAQTSITILCSYFLPGKLIRRLIRNAARRGVKIKLISAGHSDIKLAKYAERWMYDWLLRNNIELYEYQPAVLHAKVAVCDSQWFTIGSYNINNISAYASIELNLDVHHAAVAGQMEATLQHFIEKDCTVITLEKHLHSKNIIKQFARWSAYEFIRLAFFLITFYYKQKR